jgi:hypothetical protein
MGIPNRTGKTSTTDSEQDVLGSSFDGDFGVLAFEALGYDGTALRRLKVNTSGETVIANDQVQTLIDDVTTTNVKYVGKAPIGTATSAPAWTIFKIDKSATPITLKVQWASAGASTCIYDNRASLSYS